MAQSELEVFGGNFAATGGGITYIGNYKITTTVEEKGNIFGARYAYYFNNFLGVDLNLGFTSNDHTAQLWDTEYSETEDISNINTTSLLLFNLNGRLHYLFGWVDPSLTAGIGYFAFIKDLSFTYNYGAGLKILITKVIGLKFDYREYYTEYKSTIRDVDWVVVGDPTEVYGTELSFTDQLSFKEMSVSLIIIF
jgi:opacity protein-like surface antigen